MADRDRHNAISDPFSRFETASYARGGDQRCLRTRVLIELTVVKLPNWRWRF
ncbi:MAG: hypothetical protein SCH68_12635 [Brevefilum sp.]|nr:hypothetical protein [Brevefilum sp.]